MSETIISLSPTMTRRSNFEHLLMDQVDDYKFSEEEANELIRRIPGLGEHWALGELIMGYLWLAKDVVCRFRAHWPETIRMTDDMASEALEALTEFVNNSDYDESNFFNGCQQFIVKRVTVYINDNRSICSASRTTNERRAASGQPLEYHFPVPIHDDSMGECDPNPSYVDLLDAMESLREADREHLHTLITMFLEQDHDIDEESLSDEEREAIAKLSEIGKNL